MAVKMRLTRMGDKKSPFYRIVVVDSRKARDGEYIDLIGTYAPVEQPAKIKIDVEKAKDWLSKGVQPTETVRSLLVSEGVLQAKPVKKPSKRIIEESPWMEGRWLEIRIFSGIFSKIRKNDRPTVRSHRLILPFT